MLPGGLAVPVTAGRLQWPRRLRLRLLGGVGTLLGPLMGAGLVVSLQHLLAQSPLGNWVSVILGIIFVVCVLSFRSGIIGELAKMYRKNFK